MNTKLYVGNLSANTSAEDLRMLFASAGGVVSVELIKDKNTGKPKGYAFIEMVSQGDAGKAVSEFNRYCLDQHRIKVMVAKTESQPSRRTNGGYVEYKSYRDAFQPSQPQKRRSYNR